MPNDVEELLARSASTDIQVLLTAKESAKRAALDEPSQANLAALDRASKMLESAMEATKNLKNWQAVLDHVADNGRKLSKTKLYSDINRGLLRRQPDGTFRLRDVQRMSQEEGINLAGIRRILELERRVEALEEERDALRDAVTAAEARRNRVFAASADGQVMPIRRGERPWDRTSRRANGSGGSLTVWSPVRALAALAAAQTSARSELPAPPRSKAHDVIEGTIVSQR